MEGGKSVDTEVYHRLKILCSPPSCSLRTMCSVDSSSRIATLLGCLFTVMSGKSAAGGLYPP